MTKRPRRQAPSDPQAIALARARDRALEREKARRPENWGVANDLQTLPANEAAAGDGVQVHRSKQKREVFAKRLDPFQSLARKGSLDPDQHHAANRLFRDWCLSKGIKTDDARPVLELEKVDLSRPGPSDRVNQRMIDAGTRYDEALAMVGPGTAKVLDALVQPKVMCGSVVIWRGEVKRITREVNPHGQATVVRQACENLRLVYEAIDERRRREQSGFSASEAQLNALSAEVA